MWDGYHCAGLGVWRYGMGGWLMGDGDEENGREVRSGL